MTKSFISFILIALLSSCSGWSPLYHPPRPTVKDYGSDSFTRVSVFHGTSVAHKWRWYLEDGWIGYDDFDTVSRIYMRYRTQNILSLKEARTKLVDFVHDFMDQLESDGDAFGNIDPDFGVENLKVVIDLQTYWGMYADPDCVGWMVLENGMVYYYNFDVKNRDVDYWLSRIESFAKSEEVVALEREAESAYYSELKPVPAKDSGTKVINESAGPNRTVESNKSMQELENALRQKAQYPDGRMPMPRR